MLISTWLVANTFLYTCVHCRLLSLLFLPLFTIINSIQSVDWKYGWYTFIGCVAEIHDFEWNLWFLNKWKKHWNYCNDAQCICLELNPPINVILFAHQNHLNIPIFVFQAFSQISSCAVTFIAESLHIKRQQQMRARKISSIKSWMAIVFF